MNGSVRFVILRCFVSNEYIRLVRVKFSSSFFNFVLSVIKEGKIYYKLFVLNIENLIATQDILVLLHFGQKVKLLILSFLINLTSAGNEQDILLSLDMY